MIFGLRRNKIKWLLLLVALLFVICFSGCQIMKSNVSQNDASEDYLMIEQTTGISKEDDEHTAIKTDEEHKNIKDNYYTESIKNGSCKETEEIQTVDRSESKTIPSTDFFDDRIVLPDDIW